MFYLIIQFTPLQPPSIPPFNNPVPEQAFLAKNDDEYSKKSDRILEGHFETLLTLPVWLLVLSVLWEEAVSLPNERALSKMESGIGPANTFAIECTTRRLGGRAGTAGLSPLGTSSSPTSVGSVRSPGSPSANTGTHGAKGQS